MTETDTLLDLVRAGGEREVLNVKFFRGSKDIITVDEFRREIRSALMQRKIKTATVSTEAPKSKHPKISVKEILDAR